MIYTNKEFQKKYRYTNEEIARLFKFFGCDKKSYHQIGYDTADGSEIKVMFNDYD